MIRTFAQHEVCAGPGRQDVFPQVHEVDGIPDSGGRIPCLSVRERGVAMEI